MEDRYGEDCPRYNYLSSAELDPQTRRAVENMKANKGWWIIGAAILTAAFLSSGLYSVVAVSRADGVGYTTIVNRFTGSAWYCAPSECAPIPTRRP